MKINSLYRLTALITVLFLCACSAGRNSAESPRDDADDHIDALKLAGGSSGMEQIGDCTYLAVYDLKNHSNGIRLGLISVADEALSVVPVKVDSWGTDAMVNDLESICSVPGRPREFLVAEAGNWQGVGGRIFHIRVDIENGKAEVLGIAQYPKFHNNDFDLTGDQYEGMFCLPYDDTKCIVVLGERGGSEVFPHGILRWGILDLEDHTLDFRDEGLNGAQVDVPGNWADPGTKRDITDFHIDAQGGIWAVASEDQGDAGPFYSVIYKLGQTDNSSPERPFTVYETIDVTKEVSGFKIEALSGPCGDLNSTHSFSTEDELYGGVWRPITVE